MSETPGFGDVNPLRQTVDHVEHTLYGQRTSAESVGTTQDSPGEVAANEVPIADGHSLEENEVPSVSSRGDGAALDRGHPNPHAPSRPASPALRFSQSLERIGLPPSVASPRTPKRHVSPVGPDPTDTGGGKYQCYEPPSISPQTDLAHALSKARHDYNAYKASTDLRLTAYATEFGACRSEIKEARVFCAAQVMEFEALKVNIELQKSEKHIAR